MAGRFIGSALMSVIKAEKMLVVLGLLGVILMLVSMVTEGQVAIWCLVLCGLANSIMYPTIFALGIAELGPLTSKGSGVITIGNVGGAVIPPLFGLLADKVAMHYAMIHDSAGVQLALASHVQYHSVAADKVGIQYAFIVPVICYLFITYYGFSGYKPTRAAKA
jgi:FHS family L-fucose permease-like MFS transporter